MFACRTWHPRGVPLHFSCGYFLNVVASLVDARIIHRPFHASRSWGGLVLTCRSNTVVFRFVYSLAAIQQAIFDESLQVWTTLHVGFTTTGKVTNKAASQRRCLV